MTATPRTDVFAEQCRLLSSHKAMYIEALEYARTLELELTDLDISAQVARDSHNEAVQYAGQRYRAGIEKAIALASEINDQAEVGDAIDMLIRSLRNEIEQQTPEPPPQTDTEPDDEPTPMMQEAKKMHDELLATKQQSCLGPSVQEAWRQFRLDLQTIFEPPLLIGDSANYKIRDSKAFFDAMQRMTKAVQEAEQSRQGDDFTTWDAALELAAQLCESEFADNKWHPLYRNGALSCAATIRRNKSKAPPSPGTSP